jgi:hypothetical protein
LQLIRKNIPVLMLFNQSKRLDGSHFDENGPAYAVNLVMGSPDLNLKAAAGGYDRPTTGKVFWNVFG